MFSSRLEFFIQYEIVNQVARNYQMNEICTHMIMSIEFVRILQLRQLERIDDTSFFVHFKEQN